MSQSREERLLCISSYVKGHAFLRQAAAMGCKVVLLTLDKHRDADWPRESLELLETMPSGLTLEQITNTVAWLARTRRFDRIISLDEFDMETAAHLREHLRIPGMGRTLTAHFRDKLAMRCEAEKAGALVPDFIGVFNYDDLRAWMDSVPGPWLLKPRSEASAIGIRRIHEPEQLWRALEELGDRQSYFVLEQFIPGQIYHVDSIVSEREVLFTSVSRYGQPPMKVMHEGGVFTTRILDRDTPEAVALTGINGELVPRMGMVRGVTHAEYIHGEDGRYYFLEIAGRVGGAYISDVIRHATGVDLWTEWARIEVAHLRYQHYALPKKEELYAGSVLCLARTEKPDTSGFDAPEIIERIDKHHHAGLIVRSTQATRVQALLEDYSRRFAELFLATAPVPDKPPA
ncbi:ATP-grasp domain-containing protein [Silvibacterium sp.]|uniref:ATP-grasp domain-containing protein n=1 Tax=Silvibacterium sp. TaxID=1964179 RepID=UPI0039E4098A